MNRDLISTFLDQQASVLFLVSRKEDGKIIHYNSFAEGFIGKENLTNIYDVIIDFTGGFSLEDMALKKERVKLSVNTVNNDPQTLDFSFIANGESVYIFGETDINESGDLQKEMLRLNDDYADLTRELYKKNSELEKLNDLKNQFLGMAAHDLRNPIGNIVSIASLLQEELYTKLNQQEKKFLNVISDLGEFGLNLLNDLLEIAKIESEKRNLEVESSDPNKLIREALKFNEYYAKSQNVKLVFNSPGKVQAVMANAQAFHQILNNLISNAIKYSPENTRVEVGFIPGDKNHSFYVKDEGPGIPEDEQDKLFKPFSKTSLKPRGIEKSTGLGLWIVNMLVRSHAGNIWLESGKGKGTTIFFSIPVQ
jgi:signal transduction histidine kinase